MDMEGSGKGKEGAGEGRERWKREALPQTKIYNCSPAAELKTIGKSTRTIARCTKVSQHENMKHAVLI